MPMEPRLIHSCDKPLFVVNPRYRSSKWSDVEDYRVTQRRRDYKVSVPCGHCFTCRRKRSNSWHFRIYQEALHTPTHRYKGAVVPRILFVTFTFNDASLPKTSPKTERSVLAPFISEWREMWRYRFGVSPRYFAVTDLGTERARLHLHLLIFNPVYKDGRPIPLSRIYVAQKRKKGNTTPNPPLKNLLWKHGWTDASYIRGIAAIHYISGYMTHANVEKKARKKKVRPHSLSLKHVPSIFVSQGLGKSFLYTNDFQTLRSIKSSTARLGKFTYAVPRYYRKYYYDEIPVYITSPNGKTVLSCIVTREDQMSADHSTRMSELLELFENTRGRPPIKAFGKTYFSKDYSHYAKMISTYLSKFYDAAYDYSRPCSSTIEENLDFVPHIYSQPMLF